MHDSNRLNLDGVFVSIRLFARRATTTGRASSYLPLTAGLNVMLLFSFILQVEQYMLFTM